ncbi:RING-H2 finger protein ATL74-like [Phalaenopsis equestris]|uniref:RING-H2 finger protein ATL74-like n=1 Tax=Phalaenopsis equestris TaxID=78828 RepID=UPI0009E337F1|nr:RING-H2 finger protein ATL74-like [Phalaenopsis equestris]
MPPSTISLSPASSMSININSRRRLQTGFAGEPLSSGEPTGNSIGVEFISIIAVLLSFVIFALLLDFIVRCVVRCFHHVSGPINLDGATDEIRKLPIAIHGSDCSICLNQIETGERVRFMPNCGHGFHVECLDRWLAVRPSCPTCRKAPFAVRTESTESAELDEVVFKALKRKLGL